ncbi:MAG: hypothetical protein JXQ90_18340 [Cyclobacteriaceae bacterium]
MKSKFNLLRLACVLAYTLAMFSCATEDEIIPDNTEISDEIPARQKLILDKEGYNPYTPDKMQMAFDSLKAKLYQNFPGARVTTEEIEIDLTPNNKYIRYLPADTLEYDSLMGYEDIAFFNYPIDLPVVQQGEYEPEPDNAEGFSWLYAVVPMDFEFPSFEHEVINDVFIPDYPEITQVQPEEESARTLNDASVDSLEAYGLLMGVELYSLYLSGHMSEAEADEYLALLEGDESAFDDEDSQTERTIQSTWDSFIESLKSVKKYSLLDLFVTPAYAKKANPVKWCYTCIWNKSWTPNGTVRFKYNNGSFDRTVPMKGATVVINYSLRTARVSTSYDGKFSAGKKFGTSVNYKLEYTHKKFDIKRGSNLYVYKTNLKTNTRTDNLVYTFDLANNGGRIEGEKELAATVFVAANYFHEQVKYRRPGSFGIRISTGRGTGTHSAWKNFIPFGNPIKIYGKTNRGTTKTVRTVFGTTLHEMGHASHFWLDRSLPNAFMTRNDEMTILKESWAEYIEQDLTSIWFRNYITSGSSARNITFTQMNRANSDGGRDGKYTSLFFDLADTNDQSQNGSIQDMPRDRVQRYTFIQMQAALTNASSMNQFRDRLMGLYSNNTEQHVPALLNSYRDNLNPR